MSGSFSRGARNVRGAALSGALARTARALAWTLALAWVFAPPPAAAQPPVREILELVRGHALRPPAERVLDAGMDDPALRNREGLNAFLRAFDPYAAYIPHAELEELRDMRERYGYGVGMDIVYDQEGRAICIPYAAGPAARNGIAYGDVLLKVDGYDVSGADIDDLAVLVRGEAGTVVELAVLHPQDKSQNEVRTISVQRERVSPPLVQVETNTPEEARIRLYGFSPPVPARLREALASVLAAKPKRLIVDMRQHGRRHGSRPALRGPVSASGRAPCTRQNKGRRKAAPRRARRHGCGRAAQHRHPSGRPDGQRGGTVHCGALLRRPGDHRGNDQRRKGDGSGSVQTLQRRRAQTEHGRVAVP